MGTTKGDFPAFLPKTDVTVNNVELSAVWGGGIYILKEEMVLYDTVSTIKVYNIAKSTLIKVKTDMFVSTN